MVYMETEDVTTATEVTGIEPDKTNWDLLNNTGNEKDNDD